MNLHDTRIPTFIDFLNENEKIPKVYAVVNDELDTSNKPIVKLIEQSFEKYFDRVVIDALKKPIGDFPVINYTQDSNDKMKRLIKDGIINEQNLYNKPDLKEITGDKKKFHELFGSYDSIPKTVFSVDDAKKLKFPIIAKPSHGHSGKGIVKFEKKEDVKGNFDLFSEMIKIDKEYRVFCFRDKILTVDRRDDESEGKFMDDADTTTEFLYLKQKESDFGKFKKIVDECYKHIPLDFFSADVAEDEDGKMWIIEMNSSTGMGVEKIVKLYKEVCKDFYGEVPRGVDDQMKKDVENYQEVYKEEKLDECTIVASKIDGKIYLFKNRDRSFTPNNKVVHEKIRGVEVVYYTDQTGWIEGMNEFGVGFVFAANEGSEKETYSRTWSVTDNPKRGSKKNFAPFAKEFRALLVCKTLDDAIAKLNTQRKSGNFYLSDGKKAYEFERSDKEGVGQKLLIEDGSSCVKTNHGVLKPEAGHQYNPKQIKRASSDIRMSQAKLQLVGVKDPMEIPSRLQFQHFDPTSSLNTYRTDAEELTISQCLMKLKEKEFHFYHNEETANSVKIEDKMKDGQILVVVHK